MKKFKINVNGKTYEVEVEEIGGASSVATPIAAPVTTTPAATAAPQAATPAPAGAEVVSAPMPGKIMAIKVTVGQQVKEGDLILVLEAMKMENEIFCGTGGTVKEIKVSEGAAVNPGDALVIIG
jgi:biotin carboxyl carrier protein